MIGTVAGVLNAAIFFVASHLVLSAPPLRQLLAAGTGVFTERPLCELERQFRVREADAALAAPAIRGWRAGGLAFGMDCNYRFFRHFAAVRKSYSSRWASANRKRKSRSAQKSRSVQ